MCEILFPVGRMVSGSFTKAYPRLDSDGKEIADKDPVYSFGYAIPKTGEASWQQTAWGQQIKKVADDAYGQQTLHPMFSWKIEDGDSQIPNKKNKRPCDQPGRPGHWVMWFSQSWLPRLVDATGAHEIPPDAFITGYMIQVFGKIAANGSLAKPALTPGVYLNPVAVALSGKADVIASNDVDTKSVGFGQGVVLPAYAKPLDPAAPAFQQQAAPAPNPAILAPPAPAHVMTPAAQGASYEAMISAGWNDQLLVQHGMMLA